MRETCRVDDGHLIPVLDLGEQYLSDFRGDDILPPKYPLEIAMCDNCKLVQLTDTTPSYEMYHDRYGFKSGVNEAIRNNLAEIVDEAFKWKRKPKAWLDIASNDGTLLSNVPENVYRVGIDPITKYCKEAEEHADVIINDFFKPDYFTENMRTGVGLVNAPTNKFDVITSISMFYDLDDPNKFVDGVKSVLARGGVWSVQQNYLLTTMELNAVDNICFKPGTLILGANKNIEDIETGDTVLGMDGTRELVKTIYTNDFSGKLSVINPMYLEPIVATPNHPILVVRKENMRFKCGQFKKPENRSLILGWVPADNVKGGDFVVVPKIKRKPVSKVSLDGYNKLDSRSYRRGLRNIEITPEFAWVLGLYVAEGHTNKLQVGNEVIHFTLNSKETEYANRVKKYFASIGYKTSIRFPDGKNIIDVSVSCTALSRALRDWCGTKAPIKKIPEFIMYGENEVRVSFLRGLFAGDGYIKGNKVHLHSTSKILILQSQLLLTSLGAMVGISYTKPYPRILRGKILKSKDSWQLRGASPELAKIFGYRYRGKSIAHHFEDNNFIYLPVKSVGTEKYDGPVYNFETTNHTYIVSNAVVHNCHEHLEYYSLLALENLLGRHGLEVFDCSTNMINGGSIRTLIQHAGERPVQESVLEQRQKEADFGIGDSGKYQEFGREVEKRLRKLAKLIVDEQNESRTTYIYGASTRGGTIWQGAGLDVNHLPKAVERNPEKVGKKIASIQVPIISEEQARQEHPDNMLISPWFFRDVFIEREREYLESGGRFIFPLPEVEIVWVEDGELKSQIVE